MTVNSLGGAAADVRARNAAWYAPLVPIAISIFAVSALVSYHLRAGAISGSRTFAQSLIVGIYEFFGWVPSCMFFGLVLAWSSIWWVTGTIEQPGKKLARIGYLTLALAVFGNLDAAAPHTGQLGAWLGGGLGAVFGSFLSHLLMAPLTFLALLLATDYFWMSYFERRAFERTLPTAVPGLAAGAGVHDLGVEPAVTEEFKELARILPQHAPAAREPEDRAEFSKEAVGLALDRYFEEPPNTTPDASESLATATPDDAAIEEDLSRLSYFERRQLRAAREAAAADQIEFTGQAESTESSEAAPGESLPDLDFAPAVAPIEIQADGDEVAVEPVAPVADADEAPAEIAAAVDDGTADERVTGEVAADEVARELAPTDDGDETLVEESTPLRAPVLEETALRAALGFELGADDAAVEDGVVVEDGTAIEADVEAEAPTEYELRSEPLFPSAPEDLGADEDEADDEEDVPEAPGVVLEPMAAVDRPRGFLAPVRDEADADERPADSATPAFEAEADDEVAAEAGDGSEPVVAIPRPAEGPRQQSLFISTLDEGLVRDALEVLQSNNRATASMLQRRLRIDYEQAKEVLALLAHRGLVDLAEDGSQARRRG